MAFDIALQDLKKEDNMDANKILNSLLDPKNIDMKTHIMSPINFAILESVIKNLEGLLTEVGQQKLALPMTKKVLKDMVTQLKKFLVSWNRLSREEITKTLQSLRQEGMQERSLYQKLLGLGKN